MGYDVLRDGILTPCRSGGTHDLHEPVPRVSFCAKHVVTDDDDDDEGRDALLQEGKYPAQAVDDEKRIAQVEWSRMQLQAMAMMITARNHKRD